MKSTLKNLVIQATTAKVWKKEGIEAIAELDPLHITYGA